MKRRDQWTIRSIEVVKIIKSSLRVNDDVTLRSSNERTKMRLRKNYERSPREIREKNNKLKNVRSMIPTKWINYKSQNRGRLKGKGVRMLLKRILWFFTTIRTRVWVQHAVTYSTHIYLSIWEKVAIPFCAQRS